MSAKQSNGAAKAQQRAQPAAEKTRNEATQAAKAGTESVEKAAKANTEAVETAVATGKDAMGTAFDFGNQAFAQGFEQMLTLAREQVGRFYPDGTKGFDDVVALQKSNIDAIFAAQAAAAKGAEAIGGELYSFNKKAVDASFDTMTKLLNVKTVQDAVALQSGYARTRFEEIVAESARLSELTVQTGKETVEPISARVTETVGKAMKSASA